MLSPLSVDAGQATQPKSLRISLLVVIIGICVGVVKIAISAVVYALWDLRLHFVRLAVDENWWIGLFVWSVFGLVLPYCSGSP